MEAIRKGQPRLGLSFCCMFFYSVSGTQLALPAEKFRFFATAALRLPVPSLTETVTV